ncbi:MAG: hypothetical protein LC104_11195 [Bacteroidales bacterium]|nr:hypothetical protein [Bacteroidales bacterium]
MNFPEPDVVEQLKRTWTDQYVRVKPGSRPELTRFEGDVGRVVTVNMAGRAIVDFADGAWYDVPNFADVLETVTDATEIQKYDATMNGAQKFPIKQS